MLAEKLSVENSDIEEKIVKAFRLIINRKPTSSEKRLLNNFFKSELEGMNKNKEQSEKLLSAGEFKGNKPSPLAAALMNTVVMIYNMDEAIVK